MKVPRRYGIPLFPEELGAKQHLVASREKTNKMQTSSPVSASSVSPSVHFRSIFVFHLDIPDDEFAHYNAPYRAHIV